MPAHAGRGGAKAMANRPEDDMQTAAYWRARADEARALKAEMRSQSGKEIMEQVAQLYERMATLAARREGP